jgi:MFS family permease
VKSTKREGLGTVRSNLPLIKFLAIAFFILLAMSLSWPLTPVYLQEIKLVSVATIGILGSLNALGVVILNLVVGRFKSRQGFLISLVLVGFSVIFIWKGMGILWYGLGYFFAAGFRLFRVLATGHIESFVSIDTAGLGYGIAETVWILTFVVVSPIAGFLYEVEPELPFPVSLVMILISILLIPRLIPPTPQDITTTTQVETFTRKETT